MKISRILLWNCLWGLFYFGTNNLALFPAYELPFLPGEEGLGFNEWWMFPYLSWFAYNIIFCLSIRSGAKDFVRLMTVFVVIHALIFVFFPIELPRTYDPERLSRFSRLVLSGDQPRNCCPSLHVSFVVLTLLLAPYLGISRRLIIIFSLWGSLIIVSVLFVRQHYFLDILASIALSSLGIYFFLLGKLKLSTSNKADNE